MGQQVALLRGINVGGHRKVPMAALKKTFESLGLQGVQTHIQSGNVVFLAAETDLQVRLEERIEQDFGFPVQVVLRTASQWKAVLERNPFPDQTEFLHVAFLSETPAAAALNAFGQMVFDGERWQVVGQQMYLLYPNGQARTRLTHTLIERKLGVAATARNWKTVLALAKLLQLEV